MPKSIKISINILFILLLTSKIFGQDCILDEDCDDANPCNGTEYCDITTGFCESDNISGCPNFCDELLGCVDCLVDSHCPSGQSCQNGICSVILTVELKSFSAVSTHEGVIISWTSSYESNHNKYIIQRSSNGIHFNDIHFIYTSTDSEDEKSYSYLDKLSITESNYYRLAMVDNNGHIEYSKLISIKSTNLKNGTLKVYPSFVDNEIYIESKYYEEALTVDILNINGIKINSLITQTGKIRVDVSSMNSGFYLISITTEEGLSTRKRFFKR